MEYEQYKQAIAWLHWTIYELVADHLRIWALAQSQYGCRVLKQVIKISPQWASVCIQQLFPPCCDDRSLSEWVLHMSKHCYGNYVMQCLLHNGEANHKVWFATKIASVVHVLCLHNHGAMVVYRALDYCQNPESQTLLNKALQNFFQNDENFEKAVKHRHAHKTLLLMRHRRLPDTLGVIARLAEPKYTELLSETKKDAADRVKEPQPRINVKDPDEPVGNYDIVGLLRNRKPKASKMGSEIVQKVIHKASGNFQDIILVLCQLRNHMAELSFDRNANHAIKKFVKCSAHFLVREANLQEAAEYQKHVSKTFIHMKDPILKRNVKTR